MTAAGRRKLLLINKTAEPVALAVPDGGTELEQLGGGRTTLAGVPPYSTPTPLPVVSYALAGGPSPR
ncbi:hypothetical protein [Nocardia sp. XZ_19_385]|uniref:hypothetical protein n=1 Tax=Nocardia sp. XZ_19_385 TaxID=2769488 RepID=UPI00188FE3A6|nr:hypothetical protein [Nocardia sp. XZ_19_385]